MIRAEELQIGDWVRIKSDIEPNDAYWLHDMQPGQALEVEEILSNSINPCWCCGEIIDYVPEDAIQPIPLTPEILRKNGFTNGEFYAESHIEDWQIMSDGSHLAARSERGWCIDIPCRYTHELQHALRLCKIDKEIVL